MKLKVEVRGFDQMFLNTRKSGAVLTRAVVGAIRRSVTIVTLAAKNAVPVGATGALKRSITSTVNERNLVGVVGLDYPGRTYGLHVERGTRPHWPPIEPLRRWAAQRGISPYAVQRAIARRGTRAQPFMAPAYRNNQRFIRDQFRNVGKEVVGSIKRGD